MLTRTTTIMTMQDTTTPTNPLRIAFWGTPAFAVPVLVALEAAGLTPQAVVTMPDKPVGRKQIVTPPPVKVWAGEHEIEVFQPESLKNFDLPGTWDLFVVAAYGKIIPEKFLTQPRRGTLNVHPSLLPKFRGPSPLQSSILAGEKHTGVAIILLDNDLDHGPIIAEAPYTMKEGETHQTLHDTLGRLGGALLASSIPAWVEGRIVAREQDHAEATFTKKFTTEDGLLDFHTMSAEEIDRRVKALNPDPGTYVLLSGNEKPFRVKILDTKITSGKLEIVSVQPEGKTPMDWQSFKRRFPQMATFGEEVL